jgi:phosphoglycolate phosphatase-like HAD superfamily hydrolase
VACEEIPGATQALKCLTMTHQLFINTATATQAAEEIIDRREWSQYIRGVLGFPPGKLENLQAVAQQVSVRNHEIVMVGDDDHDAEAANAFGCPFIAVQRTSSHFTRPPVMIITRLDELPPVLALL